MNDVTLEKDHKTLFGRIVEKISPNQSSRFGKPVRASVAHTTESDDTTFDAIVRFLTARGIPASAHYVIDAHVVKTGDEFTRVARLVQESRKAWTVLSANPTTVNYEMIGRARRTRADWLARPEQLRTFACLVADDILDYRLPNKHSYPGYLGHVDLTAFGFPQTHTDPGHGFPWDFVTRAITGYLQAAKKPDVPVEPHKAPTLPRPLGVPKTIPLWAWQLREWHLGVREVRPVIAPKLVPEWYWDWRVWFDQIHAHAH